MTDSMENRKDAASAPSLRKASHGDRAFPRNIARNSLVCAAVAAGLATLSTIGLGLRAATINSELNAAQAKVRTMEAAVLQSDADAAMRAAQGVQAHTAKAREASSDPLWTVAGGLPWLGANFRATSQVATTADDVAQLALTPLASVVATVDWKSLLPNEQGQLTLGPLAAAQPKIATAAQAARQSSDRLNTINADELLPQISNPLNEAREQLTSFSNALDSAADAARLVPDMLGHKAPRHYLLLIQNNAEVRSTGGIPGALAVLTADEGKLTLNSQTSASALGAFSPVISVDPEQRAIYSARLGKFMQDINLTPDFPAAAKTGLSMWKARTGDQLDGVLSIDPVALSYILSATGPVTLNDPTLRQITAGGLPTELTGKNVVPTLLSDVYSKIADPSLQDAYFAGVAQEVFLKLSAGSGDTKKLIDGLTHGAAERRVLLWSSKADEQNIISQYPFGGSISGSGISPAQFGVYFNDGTGAKMDYHVKRTVQLIKKCPADGYSEVGIRIISTNTAPRDAATSLPEYVTGAGAFGIPAGTVQTNIMAYGPVQAHVETAVADGSKIGFASQLHSGRPVGTVTISLPPGKSSTVEFTFGKIVQDSEPELAVTPTVQAREDVVLDPIHENCVPAP